MCCKVRWWTWQALCLFVSSSRQQYTFTGRLFGGVREWKLRKRYFCSFHLSVRPSKCNNSRNTQWNFVKLGASGLCKIPPLITLCFKFNISNRNMFPSLRSKQLRQTQTFKKVHSSYYSSFRVPKFNLIIAVIQCIQATITISTCCDVSSIKC